MAEWIKFVVWAIGIALGVLGTVWRLLTKPMLDQLNGYGKRLEKAEVSANLVERTHERINLEITGMRERMGESDGAFKGVQPTLDAMRREVAESNTHVRERLASLEAKMDVAKDLKDAIGDFGEIVQDAVRSLKP